MQVSYLKRQAKLYLECEECERLEFFFLKRLVTHLSRFSKTRRALLSTCNIKQELKILLSHSWCFSICLFLKTFHSHAHIVMSPSRAALLFAVSHNIESLSSPQPISPPLHPPPHILLIIPPCATSF